jgi:ubiquinone/menaquinone biosynthesis C-methylase UbiE
MAHTSSSSEVSSLGRRALSAFTSANRWACEVLAGALPHTRVDVFVRYSDIVARMIDERPDQLVVDVGAGHVCPYVTQLPAAGRIVGVDLSLDAMKGNGALSEKRVADVVADGLPFADAEVDIVTSRSVVEHLSNIERFVEESARVLKPGGYSIHLLSGGFSHVALINRIIPQKLSVGLLYALHPTSSGAGGHPVAYDRCYYSALKELFQRSGHEDVDVYASFGSDYFYFFVPLFLLESMYLIALQTLRLKRLAMSYLVVARRASRPGAFDVGRL